MLYSTNGAYDPTPNAYCAARIPKHRLMCNASAQHCWELAYAPITILRNSYGKVLDPLVEMVGQCMKNSQFNAYVA